MMKHSKERILLLAMTDSINGEAAGESIEALYEAGAMNVQILNTITKKNRPGFLYLIDADETVIDDVETVLVRKVGTTGWHRVPSIHCYTEVRYLRKTVRVQNGVRGFDAEVACKYSPEVPEPYRIENGCCSDLQRKIREELGADVSRQFLHGELVRAFQSGDNNYVIDVQEQEI